MINKKKLYSIVLLIAAIILFLVGMASAAPFAYITNSASNNVSVIDTATNAVTANVSVDGFPYGELQSPQMEKKYM
jgi:YVTN family beta-propeller protein